MQWSRTGIHREGGECLKITYCFIVFNLGVTVAYIILVPAFYIRLTFIPEDVVISSLLWLLY